MDECHRCKMRDDDWFLCRDKDCLQTAPFRIAALEAELAEARCKLVVINELQKIKFESETNHQNKFTRLFFNELGRFIKLQISESPGHVVITFEGPDSIIEHIITKQEILMLTSMLLKRSLEAM